MKIIYAGLALTYCESYRKVWLQNTYRIKSMLLTSRVRANIIIHSTFYHYLDIPVSVRSDLQLDSPSHRLGERGCCRFDVVSVNRADIGWLTSWDS